MAEACKKCGKLHRNDDNVATCAGHKSSDPTQPCRKLPMKGSSVCRNHGGATPLARKAAQERLALMSAQGEIAELMRQVDVPEQHPIDGLLEVVRVSGAMMRLLTIKVGELDHKPGGVELAISPEGDFLETQAHGFWMPTGNHEMGAHVYVTLLGVWSERYAKACKLALDANIDERLVRNAEQTSEMMFRAVGEALDAAALSPVQRDALLGALANNLRRYAPLELQG